MKIRPFWRRFTRLPIQIFMLMMAAMIVSISSPQIAHATSNYNYQPHEYIAIVNGRSPDGNYLISAHGDGELGYDNFHLYLMDGITGKPIGPLEEIKDTLDTSADAFHAHWSRDSHQVAITYRFDRRVLFKMHYRIDHRRAYPLGIPTQAYEF